MTIQESILVIVSVLVTAGCFNVAFYFGHRREPSYLFFAFYCFFHCFKIFLKTYPDSHVLIENLQLTAFDLVYISVVLGMLSLSTFLAYRFHQPYRKGFILAYITLSVGCFFFVEELYFIFLSIGVALVQTALALKGNRHAVLILFGLLGFAGCEGLGLAGLLNWGYFVGVIFLIACMVLSSSIELMTKNKAYENALLRSSRLENQLLKTTIQPHFILNSLTSLQELIENDPEKASTFVQDLSAEFQLFVKISDQKLISVADEIRLISSYLGIMSVRKGTDFALQTYNLSEDDEIPPGILLTLVENGISHGYENREKGVFSISKTQEGKARVYTVVNDGETSEEPQQKGMGLNYVLARLRESYEGNFSFESAATNAGWLSTIKIWE